MKNKFNLNNGLPIMKMLELYKMIIVVHEGNKYYP